MCAFVITHEDTAKRRSDVQAARSGESEGGERNELERQKKYLQEMRRGKEIVVCVFVCVREKGSLYVK